MPGQPSHAQHQAAHAEAGRLAQLLGEVIVHHAPWTADINEATKWKHTEQFLEGLEQHAAGQVGPFLQQILDHSNPPPEIASLLQEAIHPPAQFSAVIEQIFVFGIVSQILGASVQPFLQGVTNDLWTKAVADGIHLPVNPATIATASGRGLNLGDPPTLTVPDWAYTEGAKQGLSADDINLQASLVGLPPALQELFEMYRRGIITEDQVKTGLKEGDFRDDWIDWTVQLTHGYLTPLDFVRAAVQEQLDYNTARQWANTTGLDVSENVPIDTGSTGATPDMFGLAFAISGRPPGPQELARMAQRGIIPWDGTGADATTFQQGIAESDLKTKWTPALQKLAAYIPPPREVGGLLEHGAITEQQAAQFWAAGGVDPALQTGFLYEANQQHIGQDKLLAAGEVKTGYFDQIFTRQQALDLLSDLGYRDQVAADMLSIIDFKREIQAINGAIRRVNSLYTAYKLTAAKAQTALVSLGIPSDQASRILATWDQVRSEPVRLPTTGEIGLAVKYGTITQAQALDELAALGYQPRDAAIVLSAHMQAAVTPLPAAGDTITG